MESFERSAVYLAQNILALRRMKKWSQSLLAKQAGIPRSTLTHMESGEGNPSLMNLVRISGALGVSVEELLSRPRSQCLLVAADQVPTQSRSGGQIQIFKLLPDKLKGLEMDRMEFSPECTMGGHPHLPGTKEYLTVIKGEVAVNVAGEVFTVKRGDVLAFPGNQSHSYRNPKKAPAVALSIVIPVPAHA